MYSISWNGQSLQNYGVLVKSHALSLARTYDSMQCQDRSWAGKGQGAPCVMTLDIYITGANQAQCEERYWDVRGLLDQEDECELALDRFNDRYWMAKFDSLSPLTFVGKNVVSATLIFTIHDRAAYALVASSQTETLAENESADYGGTVYAICYNDDYVYIAGGTTNTVRKLSAIDLSLVAESASYGGTIYALCAPAGDYIYCAGATTLKVQQLKKSDLSVNAQSPSYGAGTIIYSIYSYGNYIYYGGDGGAGEYDIVKLDKATMAVEVRSGDCGGVIRVIVINSTHILASVCSAIQKVRRYLLTDLSYVDQSDNIGDNYALALTTDGLYVVAGGGANKVRRMPLADLTAEVESADLGGDVNALYCDDDYIFAVNQNGLVGELDVAFIAGATYVIKSASYGAEIKALAIDATNNRLFIGGVTVQTVWKLDTRHMPDIVYNTMLAKATLYDDGFIYVSSSSNSNYSLYKLRASDLSVVTKSINYGGLILAIAEYGDYIYIGGEVTQKVWKLSKDDLTFVAESVDYGGYIAALCADSTYVYAGGNTTKRVRRYETINMAYSTQSADYGGTIEALALNATWIYAAGATTQVVRQLLLTDLSFVADSADYGGAIYALTLDDTYIYAGGATTQTVAQYNAATMAAVASSPVYGATIRNLTNDDNYIYACGDTMGVITKYQKSDMGFVAKSEYFGSTAHNVFGLASTDGYLFACIYVAASTYELHKLDKRVLWQRSDHEITITSAGTAKCGLDFASTASQDNYWTQTYENQTSGKEFDWAGTQLNTKVLDVDSTLWYVTNDGVTAMSGVSGEFLTLSPGANVLYLENVTGTVVFGWTDRFA